MDVPIHKDRGENGIESRLGGFISLIFFDILYIYVHCISIYIYYIFVVSSSASTVFDTYAVLIRKLLIL